MNREEAKKILERIVNTYNERTHPVILTYTEMRAIKVAIEATTAQKTGHWIIFPPCFEEICMCSNCKTKFKEAYQHRATCPNCGAYMKGKEDEHSN